MATFNKEYFPVSPDSRKIYINYKFENNSLSYTQKKFSPLQRYYEIFYFI